MISLSQIRAARALLDWTQNELAKKTGLSLRALNSIERGLVVPRLDNLRLIEQAFEKADVEFGDHDGVGRRIEPLKILQLEGPDCFDKHLLDIMQQAAAPHSEVMFNLESQKDFTGIDSRVVNDYFAHIARHRMTERVLVAKGENEIIGPPATYRWMRADAFTQLAYCVYGGTVGYYIFGAAPRIILTRSPSLADMFRRQFEFNWATAETPWFARQYRASNPDEAWSVTQGQVARDWMARMR